MKVSLLALQTTRFKPEPTGWVSSNTSPQPRSITSERSQDTSFHSVKVNGESHRITPSKDSTSKKFSSFAIVIRQPFSIQKSYWGGKSIVMPKNRFEIIAIPTGENDTAEYKGQTIKKGNIYFHSREKCDLGKERHGKLANLGVNLNLQNIEAGTTEDVLKKIVSEAVVGSIFSLQRTYSRHGENPLNVSDFDLSIKVLHSILGNGKTPFYVGDEDPTTTLLDKKDKKPKSQAIKGEDRESRKPKFRYAAIDRFEIADATRLRVDEGGGNLCNTKRVNSSTSKRRFDRRLISRKKRGEIQKETGQRIDPRDSKSRSSRKAKWKTDANRKRRLDDKRLAAEGLQDRFDLNREEEIIEKSLSETLVDMYLGRHSDELPKEFDDHYKFLNGFLRILKQKGEGSPKRASETVEGFLALNPSTQVSNAVAKGIEALCKRRSYSVGERGIQRFSVRDVIDMATKLIENGASDDFVVEYFNIVDDHKKNVFEYRKLNDAAICMLEMGLGISELKDYSKNCLEFQKANLRFRDYYQEDLLFLIQNKAPKEFTQQYIETFNEISKDSYFSREELSRHMKELVRIGAFPSHMRAYKECLLATKTEKEEYYGKEISYNRNIGVVILNAIKEEMWIN